MRRKRGRSTGDDEESESETEDDDDEDDGYDELDFDSADLLHAVLPEMLEGGAVVSKTPMGVNYAVEKPITILSDGESHKVLVATIPFEATISHITTPRKSPLAYLQVCSSPVPFHHHTYHPVTYSAR